MNREDDYPSRFHLIWVAHGSSHHPVMGAIEGSL